MKTVSAGSVSQFATPITRRPRLGFIGLGWIGLHRLAAISRADVAEIVALIDPAEPMLTAAAEHALNALHFTSAKALLDLRLDGVVIATPSAQHAEQSIAALRSRFAVFCQKPLGRTAKEVSEVIDAARSANRLLGVDLSYRHTEALQKIRQ